MKNIFVRPASLFLIIFLWVNLLHAQTGPAFKVIAFYTAKSDQAHISFVHEANAWFPKLAAAHHFSYDSTNNWSNLNAAFLKKYQVVLFLDTRPEDPAQREAFRVYMEHGGGWMGFHFSAFALTPSEFNMDWAWYHTQFLGSGAYKSNIWRPVPAFLKVENRHHPAASGLPPLFKAPANEWYRWENDLTRNPAIDILMSIDPSSFPLGTGPKQDEIWHSGYYPVIWSNRNYKMIYANLGHNDMNYEHPGAGGPETLSHTFGSSPLFDTFMLNALNWLGTGKKEGI